MVDFSVTDIEQLIKRSLEKSILSTENSKLKSSIFVSSVAELLFESYKNYYKKELSLNTIDYDKESGRRISGESLFDVTITRIKTISDPGNKQAIAIIGYQMIWAVVSEAATDLPAFADGFGKLLCSRSRYYLYLNGLDQIKEESRTVYMKRRVEIAKELLSKSYLSYTSFYYAFWPSPLKIQNDDKSLWDIYQKDELLSMVQVFEL